MENQLKKSKFMYYYIIVFTVLIIMGNIILLIVSMSLTKPIYTKEMDYGGAIMKLTSDSPIYPILKTNQVIVIAIVSLVTIGLFSYFLYCFVKNKVKISKILGIILFGLTAILSLIDSRFLSAVLSLLAVGYLVNIKTNNLSIAKTKSTS